jgi:hypothetical protein
MRNAVIFRTHVYATNDEWGESLKLHYYAYDPLPLNITDGTEAGRLLECSIESGCASFKTCAYKIPPADAISLLEKHQAELEAAGAIRANMDDSRVQNLLTRGNHHMADHFTIHTHHVAKSNKELIERKHDKNKFRLKP